MKLYLEYFNDERYIMENVLNHFIQSRRYKKNVLIHNFQTALRQGHFNIFLD